MMSYPLEKKNLPETTYLSKIGIPSFDKARISIKLSMERCHHTNRQVHVPVKKTQVKNQVNI